VREPARELAQKLVRDPARKPVRDPARKPVRELAREPAPAPEPQLPPPVLAPASSPDVWPSARDEERLRRRFPIAQVQPRPLAEYPLVLCRLMEETGFEAPDPYAFIHGDAQVRATAWSSLKRAVAQLVASIETSPTVRSPASTDCSFGSASGVSPRLDTQEPWIDHRVARRARHRRFVRSWWSTWLDFTARSVRRGVGHSRNEDQQVSFKEERMKMLRMARARLVEVPHSVTDELRPALWLWLASATMALDRVREALAAERKELALHLDALNMDLNLFLPRWVTCLFASALPAASTLRLIDRILGNDGGDALPRLALAVLCRTEKALRASNDLRDALDELGATVEAVAAEDIDIMLSKEWPASRLERARKKGR